MRKNKQTTERINHVTVCVKTQRKWENTVEFIEESVVCPYR